MTPALKDRLAGEALQLDADINKLSGKLRGYPVSASGKLALADEQLKVDALKIVSGANKIAVNGTLGQEQAALVVAIDAPALETLWPSLGGSLKGDGHLQGAWKNPSVKFQAQRQAFAFCRTQRRAVSHQYRLLCRRKKNLQNTTVSKRHQNRHNCKLQNCGLMAWVHLSSTALKPTSILLTAMYQARLQAVYKAGVWQGDFSKLDLNTPDSGRWQLTR